ncbi:hypothetical protein ES332_A12G111300v1 [Gossypium tomentosum]|uniref:PHD-type zinc finger plants domain-containing protein n=1 Tax=Gossypium tomentosum TaxID=34277 RepID=A0A5D2MVF1_GOSTO|nr:hypothetical protein ES332_A12G111300v1 [Gossypium tomentosum]
MVDRQTVCCMCGDVGFFDKLFRCNKCRYRFQHSYCSNYYSEFAEPIELCDWCRSEERNSKHGSSSKKSPLMNRNETRIVNRSEYSGDKIKQHNDDHQHEHHHRGKNSGTPSPRPTTRRYKLLKDVMC